MQRYIDFNQFNQQTGADLSEYSPMGNQANFNTFGMGLNQGNFQQPNFSNNIQQRFGQQNATGNSFGNDQGGTSQYNISPSRVQQIAQQVAQQSPQLLQNQNSSGINQRSLNTAQFQQQTGANPSEYATNIPVNFNQFRQTTGQEMDGLSQFGQGFQNQFGQNQRQF